MNKTFFTLVGLMFLGLAPLHAAAPVVTSSSSLDVETESEVTFEITASNSPVKIEVSWLPDGLSFDPDTWTISGTPSVLSAGEYLVEVVASNADGTGVQDLTLTVADDGSTNTTAWVRRASSPSGLYAVFNGNGRAVALGYRSITTSINGTDWISRASGATSDLNAGTYAAWLGLYVVVGEEGEILTSPDGATWTARTSGTTYTLNDVTTNGALLVAVGDGGTVLTSANGTTWTLRTTGTFNTLGSVAYGNGRFVAESYAEVVTSTNGTTWVKAAKKGTFVNSGSYLSYVAEDGLFVQAHNGFYVSMDGVTWSKRSRAGTPAGRVVKVGGAYLASGSYWSADGETWTQETSVSDGNYICELNGLLLRDAGGYIVSLAEEKKPVITSGIGADGVLGGIFNGYDITATGDPLRFNCSYLPPDLALDPATGSIAGTPQVNGAWSVRLDAYTAAEHPRGSMVVTVSPNSDKSSAWVVRTPDTYKPQGLWTGGGLAVSAGDDGKIYTSPDGTTWTAQSSGVSTDLFAGIHATQLGLHVVVGEGGVILTSPDGVTWTARTSGTSQTLRAVAWSGSVLVAGGENGTILSSGNGITWTSRESGTSDTLDVMAYGNGRFVIDRFIYVIISTNGTSWTTVQKRGATPLGYYMTYLPEDGVFVEVYGSYYESTDGVFWVNRTNDGPTGKVVKANGIYVTSWGDWSDDGKQWTWENSGSLFGTNICLFNGLLIAAGETTYVGRRIRTRVAPSAVASRAFSRPSPVAVEDVPFRYQIEGSANPNVFGATGLPEGLSVNATTGEISGSVAEAGTYPFDVTVSNGTGTPDTQSVTLEVLPAPVFPQPVVISASTASGKVGTVLTYQIVATNNPASFSATGLPAGLTLGASTGTITGKPTSVGAFSTTVMATNAAGTGTKVVKFTFAKETTVPVVTVTTPSTLKATTTATSYTVKGKATDNISPVKVQYRIDPPTAAGYGSYKTITLSGTAMAKTWSCKVATLAKGVWKVQFRALDAAGNISAVKTVTLTRK